jgi:hypothetical protein
MMRKDIFAFFQEAQRVFADRIAASIYSGPPEGPQPEWRTHVTHPEEWYLDGGGPGQYWLPKPGTLSWEQWKLRGD